MYLRRAPVALLALTALAFLLPSGCATKNSVTNPRVGPAASFSATPLTGDRPLDVSFVNSSTAGSSQITAVHWDFGDGTISSAMSPGHSYAAAGTYTVSLTVTSADGSNTQTRADYIVVTEAGALPPNAIFSGTPTAGHAPLTVTFTDASTQGSAPITAWAWTFGDGGTSTLQNPSHTYTSNGSYTVSLAVTTSVGTDTETKPGYIDVTSVPVPPTAQFSGTPREGVMPLTVQFTDQSSLGSATTFTSHSWTFGDGGTSTATNPSHIYLLAGTYNVTLTVTTADGSNSATQTGYITVHPTPVAPTANFSGTPTAGPSPLPVQFSDLSIAGTSPITAWSWTFGDGGTSSVQSPSHTYASPGSYTVSLQVTTADGQNTKTRTAYIQPCQTPVANFSGTPTTGVAPLSVSFTDQTTGNPTTWSWRFGDGGTSTTRNPSHVYSTPGTYTVSLRAGNACGSDSVAKALYITVADACPNPVYSVTAASWSNKTLATDGYITRARLTWNTMVLGIGCTKSVFAKIYTRPLGDSTWTLLTSSPCYTVSVGKNNPYSLFIQSVPKNCYDFRIDVLECGGTEVKASRGPADDTDLANQCFEP